MSFADMKTSPVTLDRRVRVTGASNPRDSSIQRLSQLRSAQFVVLLGEPGSGKSTTLELEAAQDHTTVLTVRALMTGGSIVPGSTLYLDALDEYRIDGAPTDKVYGLSELMRQVNASRWRLTCRAEDWRRDRDLEAFATTTSGKPIVIAQLLPLDDEEILKLLDNLGELNPQQFLNRALALGAQGLLENPLSVKLLRKAVSEGGEWWPQNRHELFAAATCRLAHEHNARYKGGRRRSIDQIIEATELACLLLLLSGSRAIWRSHNELPATNADTRAFLHAHDLGLDAELIADMLGSSLFRGEGEEFEPIHRTVAEYLAGRALAAAVKGNVNRAAFPVSRAIAMVSGHDHMPPTEMRGVYAWFAAHLASLGQDDSALQLIEADATTVLMYGDAAVFRTPLRRAILSHLDRTDPYFRALDVDGNTAVSGLSRPDLFEDFAEILRNTSDGTHRWLTVIEALASGPPVEVLRPLLLQIVLDPLRPEWQRRRAMDAWLNGHSGEGRTLWDTLAAQVPSSDREALRIYLAPLLPDGSLSTADIKSLIADFERTPEDNTVGRLVSLTYKLALSPPVELFDEPLSSWLPKVGERHHSVELESFFDLLLAASIRRTQPLAASRVWHWTCNIRPYRGSAPQEESAQALRSWLEEVSSRDADLLDVIIADPDVAGAPWLPGNSFTTVSGREPSAELIRHVLERAEREEIESQEIGLS